MDKDPRHVREVIPYEIVCSKGAAFCRGFVTRMKAIVALMAVAPVVWTFVGRGNLNQLGGLELVLFVLGLVIVLPLTYLDIRTDPASLLPMTVTLQGRDFLFSGPRAHGHVSLQCCRWRIGGTWQIPKLGSYLPHRKIVMMYVFTGYVFPCGLDDDSFKCWQNALVAAGIPKFRIFANNF